MPLAPPIHRLKPAAQGSRGFAAKRSGPRRPRHELLSEEDSSYPGAPRLPSKRRLGTGQTGSAYAGALQQAGGGVERLTGSVPCWHTDWRQERGS